MRGQTWDTDFKRLLKYCTILSRASCSFFRLKPGVWLGSACRVLWTRLSTLARWTSMVLHGFRCFHPLNSWKRSKGMGIFSAPLKQPLQRLLDSLLWACFGLGTFESRSHCDRKCTSGPHRPSLYSICLHGCQRFNQERWEGWEGWKEEDWDLGKQGGKQ